MDYTYDRVYNVSPEIIEKLHKPIENNKADKYALFCRRMNEAVGLCNWSISISDEPGTNNIYGNLNIFDKRIINCVGSTVYEIITRFADTIGMWQDDSIPDSIETSMDTEQKSNFVFSSKKTKPSVVATAKKETLTETIVDKSISEVAKRVKESIGKEKKYEELAPTIEEEIIEEKKPEEKKKQEDPFDSDDFDEILNEAPSQDLDTEKIILEAQEVAKTAPLSLVCTVCGGPVPQGIALECKTKGIPVTHARCR